MIVNLIRYQATVNLTSGHLFLDNKYFCDTLELPWNGDISFKSCIPEGEYQITKRVGAEYHVKEGYLLQNVSNRSGILIHSANSVSELEGCIAVGVRALDMLYESRNTLNSLMSIVGDSSILKVMNVATVWL